jgi:uncharacterized protein
MQTSLRLLSALLILIVIAVAQQPAAKTPAKSSTSTAAKPAAGTAGTSEARHKVAMELMQILLPKSHADQMIAQVDQQFLYLAAADYKKRGLTIPPDFEAKMKSALTGLVSENELANWGADSYAERFTAPELRQLITFYNSPLGKKLIKEQPEIGQEAMRKLLTAVDHRLPDSMRKQGLNPPPAQGAAQPGAGSPQPGTPGPQPGAQPPQGSAPQPQSSQPPK